jgi:hypothetical protein
MTPGLVPEFLDSKAQTLSDPDGPGLSATVDAPGPGEAEASGARKKKGLVARRRFTAEAQAGSSGKKGPPLPLLVAGISLTFMGLVTLVLFLAGVFNGPPEKKLDDKKVDNGDVKKPDAK